VGGLRGGGGWGGFLWLRWVFWGGVFGLGGVSGGGGYLSGAVFVCFPFVGGGWKEAVSRGMQENLVSGKKR